MIEELHAKRLACRSPTRSSDGRSTTGSRDCDKPNCIFAWGRRSRARLRTPIARSRTSPITRRSRPVRRDRAGDRVQPARSASGGHRACLRRRRDAAADRARDRDPGASLSAPAPCSSWAPPAIGRARRPMRWRPSRRRRRSLARWTAGSCLPVRRSATRMPAGAPGSFERMRSSSWKRRLPWSTTAVDELRIGLLAGLSRALDFAGERDRGALVRDKAIALARRREDRAGLAKVLVGSYWARGTTPLEEILSMLTEARDLAQELGDAETHTDAIAWRVADLRRSRRPRFGSGGGGCPA